MAHAGGAPPMYNNVEDIQILIDKYFEECEGEPLVNTDGQLMLNKYDMPIYTNVKPLTITGLALALGFNSRQTLLNYQNKQEFVDTITRAKSIVEAYTEGRLYDKEGSNGAKFALSNNYKGWTEKSQTDNTNNNLNTDLTNLTEDERALRIAELINNR